ncbi:MAG: acyl carrier protein [Phytoplasma sp.]|uniref:acyl carrier protein n=1 Tax=Phytoplasma sp. TaxID=2155 RepID=UPI002B4105AF|nr:acyl carrier protein [Phytoplasma sp.]WRH06889.1 MAG: acyl carrier protein [Phytoplasma sp.]
MVFEQVKKIISKKKSIKEEIISLETRLKEDLNLDSFDAVEIVIELEKTFKIKISDETMQQFKTIKDVVDHIKSVLLYF